ncbi:glycosyltransferase family 87 protein [Mangrovimonas sp. TPBH4]|uniref:glycosyltransferase family 87 protein n=1 Tax=Mangrovimonas sp. TPBH4 TaxID=1645914 RepID=UPI0006B61BF8|nr:glycosyltransferase family 87 protein [Mangrovimonas sp. TPBH4]
MVCLYVLAKSFQFEIHDFANYYFGSTMLRDGTFGPDTYFPKQFNQYVFDLGYPNLFLSYAPNTPFLALAFLPFTLVPLLIAKLIFNSISIALLCISIFRLQKIYKFDSIFLLLLPIVFFIPIKNNILFGQVYLLLLFLLTEGFIAYHQKRFHTMALLWCFAIALKVFPIILLGFLLFRKEFKALAHLIGWGLLFIIVGLLIFGLDFWGFYISEVLFKANNGEIAGAYVNNYQSMYMFLKRLFVYHSFENTSVLFKSFSLFKACLLAFKIAILGSLIYITKQAKNSLLVFSLWLLGSILISPYGSTYTFLLLMPLYLAISQIRASNAFKITCAFLLFSICNSGYFQIDIFPFNYLRLCLLLSLTGMILFHLKTVINFKTLGIVVGVFFGLAFFISSKPQSHSTILNVKTPILTYDFELKNDSLFYEFWNKSGAQIESLAFPFQTVDSLSVTIKDNQLFLGNQQLTNNHSNKLKPVVVDGRILYLSDEGQGIGFYKLRILPTGAINQE